MPTHEDQIIFVITDFVHVCVVFVIDNNKKYIYKLIKAAMIETIMFIM